METYLLVLSLAIFVGQAYSCCMPQKLEGKVGMSIGLKNNGDPLGITAMYDKWAMDTTIAKGYLSGTLYVMGYEVHQEVFQDYSQGIQYELTMGNCTAKSLPLAFKPVGGKFCMPPSSKIMTSYNGLADDTLDFDMYLIHVRGCQITMSMTTKECAPLSESFLTQEGIFNIGFMGLTEGITDPSVFEMPEICKVLQRSMRKRDVRESPFIPSI
ncbi:uncharacterized protein LOC127720190 [Mytilus californianus]|uniref:uncharacterized protein LOC127720190 n=1 Tax=Mytilus californianus TaxID=6549 RepID=UPI0022482A71|nr:uncharacterized protein LOC127720190 [Mytilus californianus]